MAEKPKILFSSQFENEKCLWDRTKCNPAYISYLEFVFAPGGFDFVTSERNVSFVNGRMFPSMLETENIFDVPLLQIPNPFFKVGINFFAHSNALIRSKPDFWLSAVAQLNALLKPYSRGVWIAFFISILLLFIADRLILQKWRPRSSVVLIGMFIAGLSFDALQKFYDANLTAIISAPLPPLLPFRNVDELASLLLEKKLRLGVTSVKEVPFNSLMESNQSDFVKLRKSYAGNPIVVSKKICEIAQKNPDIIIVTFDVHMESCDESCFQKVDVLSNVFIAKWVGFFFRSIPSLDRASIFSTAIVTFIENEKRIHRKRRFPKCRNKQETKRFMEWKMMLSFLYLLSISYLIAIIAIISEFYIDRLRMHSWTL